MRIDGSFSIASYMTSLVPSSSGVTVAYPRDRAENPISRSDPARSFTRRPDQRVHVPSLSAHELFRRDRRAVVGSKHPHKRRWRQYTDNICKSIDVKHALSQRQGGVCEFCNGPFVFSHLEDAVVHHLSYDHECTYEGRSNIFDTPECGDCLRNFEQNAAACMQWLRLLHRECHTKLHKIEARDPEWKSSVGLGSQD